MNRYNLKPKAKGSYSKKNKEVLKMYLSAKENNCEATVKTLNNNSGDPVLKQESKRRQKAEG